MHRASQRNRHAWLAGCAGRVSRRARKRNAVRRAKCRFADDPLLVLWPEVGDYAPGAVLLLHRAEPPADLVGRSCGSFSLLRRARRDTRIHPLRERCLQRAVDQEADEPARRVAARRGHRTLPSASRRTCTPGSCALRPRMARPVRDPPDQALAPLRVSRRRTKLALDPAAADAYRRATRGPPPRARIVYATTRFTSFPGTTIALRISLPFRCARTRGSSFARATSSSSARPT